MADTIFGIDKGVVKAFALMVLIVGSVTTIFLSEYISSMVLGAVFYSAVNGTSYYSVTGESFIANMSTIDQLANYPVTAIRVYNGTQEYGIANFTTTLANGSLLLNNNVDIANGTTMYANYTYSSTSTVPISSDANTLVGSMEDDFVTSFTAVNTGVKFAGALITVVAVILVFASFLPSRKKKNDLSY